MWSPSAVWIPGDPDPLQRGIPRVAEEGITVLGAPLGSPDFVEAALQAKVEKVRKITEALPDLQQPHLEFTLLRSCLALPKIMFLLRSTDTSPFPHILSQFDAITRESLGRIIGGPLSAKEWEQAKLPIPMGGVGMRAAEDHGPMAHAMSLLASRSRVRELVQPEEAGGDEEPPFLPAALLDSISSKLGEEATPEYLQSARQRDASLKIDLHNSQLLSDQLSREGNVRDIARLRSLSIADSHAGDWLTAIPSPGLGLLLKPSEFVAAMRYRLGHPIFSSDGPCLACKQPSDRLGDHAMNCAWQGERIARHNWLRDELYNTAAAACLGPTREGRALLPGEGGKPADVFIPHWAQGKDAALDVTVVNPLQAAMVNEAAGVAGHALQAAHKRKLDKSWEPCNRQGIVFLPLAVESLGAWHPLAVKEVKKLASAKARHSGDDESIETTRLFQKLSVALQRGNAALFNNRVPHQGFHADIL